MQLVRVPKGVLAAEMRAGRVALLRGDAPWFLKGIEEGIAESGVEAAAQAAAGGAVLLWPEACCKCLSKGKDVRPVLSESTVHHSHIYSGHGVAFVFRLSVPHCRVCAETANRTRPGATGMMAIGVAAAALYCAGMVVAGVLMETDGLAIAGIVGAPLAGALVLYAWSRLRSSRGRRGSRYQAVAGASLDMTWAGSPKDAELAFENATYASRFVALNKAAGVTLL